MDIEQLKTRVDLLKRIHKEEEAKKKILSELIKKKSIEQTLIGADINKNIVAREILHESSETARKKGKELLEKVTSEAIRVVTGEDLEVKINLSIKNNAMTAEMVLEAQHPEGIVVQTNPAQEDAGGAADVVSLAVFESIRMLAGTDNSAPLFLDEPLKFVSAGNADGAARLVKGLTEMTRIQTFVVTHEVNNFPGIADTAYRLEVKNGTTSIKNT